MTTEEFRKIMRKQMEFAIEIVGANDHGLRMDLFREREHILNAMCDIFKELGCKTFLDYVIYIEKMSNLGMFAYPQDFICCRTQEEYLAFCFDNALKLSEIKLEAPERDAFKMYFIKVLPKANKLLSSHFDVLFNNRPTSG